MFERFSDRARKVMSLANQEAQRFSHEYIGTEHILLGLVKEGGCVGSNILENLDVDLRKVCLEVEKLIKPAPFMVTMGKLPQTPRAKKVIEYAIEEARNLNHNYVGTEHLLLGLLREHDGIAAQVMMNLGLKLEEVREEVLNLLGAAVSPEIMVTTPSHCPQLTAEIARLELLKNDAIRSAEYGEASRYRDQAERLRQQLEAERPKCDNCEKKSTVHVKLVSEGRTTINHLCEKCAAGGVTPKATTYTDIVSIDPNQLHQLISHDVPDQPVLEALFLIEQNLHKLLAAVADPELAMQCDTGEAVKTVIKVANFINAFTELRNEILGTNE